MTLRFEKNCYPDVNIYRQRKELGLNPIPRKPNVWSRNRSLQHSATDILSSGTARQSTSFCRSFKRQGYRHDLARTKDRKIEQEYCLYTNKISTSDETEYGKWKKDQNKVDDHPSAVAFFKNKVNEAAPRWMQLKSIQIPAFFDFKKRIIQEKTRAKQFKDRSKNEGKKECFVSMFCLDRIVVCDDAYGYA